MKTFIALLLAIHSHSADIPAVKKAPALKPTLTLKNGMSCGRTSAAQAAVDCNMTQCYAKEMSDFPTWAKFEDDFLKAELDRKKFGELNVDFTAICPAYKKFNAEEKKLLWLDLLKLVAAYESNFNYLTAYDDWTEGKADTGRGLFSVGVSNCKGVVKVAADYCKIHDPKVNTSCTLDVMAGLIKRNKSKTTLDALGAHWGTLQSSARNPVGGRRKQILAAFSKHPACKRHLVPYDRLKKEMWPEKAWADPKLLPSYKPSIAGSCALDQKVAKNRNSCARQKNWDKYAAVDAAWAARKPSAAPAAATAPAEGSAQ